ncbi:uncharacterized protein EV154DRAFT_515585 [Mucor mucedo]|uniref:uncharacterized protein n=1 Tax=Mucor mucedo TaxID=29922 RepID=UPI00221EA4B6|nr:uncharacterized protein EV154DRAFT_515585 [Mucor mucedo]KAI7889155.1 hypothetical protein EV154DRAFT_515585 [Mucor mucedo]
MQQDNKWTSSPETPRNYMSLQSSYPYGSTEYNPPTNTTTVLPGMSTQPTMPGLMSGSQPSTPRPDVISPPPDSNNKLPSTSNNTAATPDLIRRRPPLPSRPASFTTTTFHSNPYPGGTSLRRRRTESSMFSFETGPSFSQTKQTLDLWNIDQSNGYQVQLQAKMDRGFFRADQDWTCYRRNYFQVSATFEVHGVNYLINGPEVPCLIRTENGEIHQVDFFSIGVSARVTGSDKRIELVQHTPKRDKGPQMIPEPRVVSAGGNLHLASVGSNHNIVTFERMQFKTATANNGKRRAAQQYYEIVVDLCANSSSGKQFKVASCTSAPLVVRGRSPGHYADSHTRYRSLDSGTPSSFPGQTGPPSATITPSGAPTSSNGEEGHQYMQSQPQPRFPGVNPSANGNSDYGNPYSSYGQPPSGYPYQVGGYAPVMNAHPVGSTRNEEEGGPSGREGGYMMPYSSHPHQHPGEPTGYYNNNNNSSSGSSVVGSANAQEPNNSNSNSHHPHQGYHADNNSKPYWSGGNREQQQQHGPGSRYSNGSPYVNPEFNGYSMRPQSQQQSNENTSPETNPLDAGRSMTPR